MPRARNLIWLLWALSGFAQDGALVDVGTHKLNVVCTGPAGARPVVVLEAGGGGTSASWKAVQAALPAGIRACAYDRAGSGKSDAGPEPRTMDAEVADLHKMLAVLRVTEPIVFVGQSLGGILARLYVHKYPEGVAGVLLIDPTDEDSLVFNTKVNRWIKVRELQDSLGDGARAVAMVREANPMPFGTRALIVIGAGKREQPPGVSAEQWLEMRSSRDQQVKALAKLSSRSKFVLDPGSGHNIERDNPKLVAEAIEELVKDVGKQ